MRSVARSGANWLMSVVTIRRSEAEENGMGAAKRIKTGYQATRRKNPKKERVKNLPRSFHEVVSLSFAWSFKDTRNQGDRVSLSERDIAYFYDGWNRHVVIIKSRKFLSYRCPPLQSSISFLSPPSFTFLSVSISVVSCCFFFLSFRARRVIASSSLV